MTHENKVNRISRFLATRKSKEPLSIKKKSVSHQVPKKGDKTHTDEKVDISDLNEILEIDVENKTCTAEPGVTFVDLVNATFKHGLVPIIVPEFKTISIGGAVAGCSVESQSFKYGGFHDTCLEYEVITAKGDVLVCTPDNENKLLFQMMHGTFGTLGIISKLKFKLIPAKKFVKMRYEKYKTLAEYKKAILGYFKNKNADFMDGIIYSPTNYALCIGNFVDQAPYSNKYDWTKVYSTAVQTKDEDYIETPHYFFRYDTYFTKTKFKSFIGRLLFGKLVSSTMSLKFASLFHKHIPEKKIPVTIDTFIPFSKTDDFLEWYDRTVGHYALWVVPYKIVRVYEWLSDDLKVEDELFLDIAIYGLKRKEGVNYYKMFEEKLMEIGGVKTLITENYYSEDDFWKTWNKENYFKIKKQTDPDNIFRDLYTKTCRAARGLE